MLLPLIVQWFQCIQFSVIIFSMILQICVSAYFCSICCFVFFSYLVQNSNSKFQIGRQRIVMQMHTNIHIPIKSVFLSSLLFSIVLLNIILFISLLIQKPKYCMNFISFFSIETLRELRRFLLPKLHSSHLHLKWTKINVCVRSESIFYFTFL